MENERTKKNFRFMIVCMSMFICVLLLTGIILTFMLKSKQNELKNTNLHNYQQEQEYKELKDKEDYKNSNQYADDYYQYTQGYGNQGDIILDVNK